MYRYALRAGICISSAGKSINPTTRELVTHLILAHFVSANVVRGNGGAIEGFVVVFRLCGNVGVGGDLGEETHRW
jgi:hypothetical protein